MNLREYCKLKNIKHRELAKKLTISRPFFSQLLNGKRRFSPALALKIEQETEGKVSRMELLYPESGEK